MRVHPRQFSTEYESVILEGAASAKIEADERMQALLMLAEKYLPGEPDACRKYAEALFHRTGIIRMDVGTWAGKKCALPS